MLKFFRYNYVLQRVVVALLAAAAWLPLFLNVPEELPAANLTTPLFLLLTNMLGTMPFIMIFLAFVLFLFSAFFFNTIHTSNLLSSRNSTFASLAFVICFASAPISCESLQYVFACPLILVVIQMMYSLLQTENPEPYLFNVGVFVALAAMFYYPSIMLIIWVLFVMISFGYKSVRLFFIPIVGMLTPYYLMLAVAYFNRSIEEVIETYSNGFCGLEMKFVGLSMEEILIVAVMSVLLLLSFVKVKSSANNSIHIRKRISTTMMLFLFSVVILLQNPAGGFGLFQMTVSVFAAMALSEVRKSRVVGILLAIVMIGAFAVQYLPLFV